MLDTSIMMAKRKLRLGLALVLSAAVSLPASALPG